MLKKSQKELRRIFFQLYWTSRFSHVFPISNRFYSYVFIINFEQLYNNCAVGMYCSE